VASYRYDPFGNTISKSGSLADANTYRFSSKERHSKDSLELYYYLYRFYDLNLQRWINRDPLDDLGFRNLARWYGSVEKENLYTLLLNNPITAVDPVGLKIWVCTVVTSGPPLYGRGNHAYFWDDRPGTPQKKRECGKEGSLGLGGNSSGNVGPTSGASGSPWNGKGRNGASTQCYPVDGSDGKEAAVMSCCRETANNGVIWPLKNDCHNSVDDCLKSNGLTSPPHPSLNPRDREILEGWSSGLSNGAILP